MTITFNSRLTDIQPNAFRGLYSLYYLKLAENFNLEILRNNTFVTLDELLILDLHRNQLEVLEENVFEPLRKIEKINLLYNRLTYIPEKLFYYNHKLKKLDLSDNKLIRLGTILSEYLSVPNTPASRISFDLEELVLSGNKNIQLSQDAFYDMMQLKNLFLSRMEFTLIERRWFLAANIENIELYANKLTNIAADTFDTLFSLKKLDLSDNKIGNLAAGCFDNQKQLVSLKLNYNEIIFLSESLFMNLLPLEELRLDHNKIGLLHSDLFKNLKNLETLTLDNNRIVGLPKGLFDSLRYLRKLTVLNNRISYIDSNTFSSLRGITMLILSSNEFNDIETETFNLEHFGSEKNIVDSQLTIVDISNNKLQELKAYSFIPLVKVSSLDISNNMISRIENGTFAKTTELQSLRLGQNKIEFLSPGIFDKLTKLTELNLVHNKLSTFPEKVFTLPLLTRLYLNFNRIQSVSENALTDTNIHELSLFGNMLTYLPHNFFTNGKYLERVVLEGNPYQCVCYEQIVTLLRSLEIRRDRYIPYIQDPRVGMWSFREGLIPVCIVTSSNRCLEDNKLITQKLLRRFYDAFVASREVCNERDYCFKNNIPAI